MGVGKMAPNGSNNVPSDGQSAALRRTEAIAKERTAAKMRVEAWTLEGKMLVRTQVLLLLLYYSQA